MTTPDMDAVDLILGPGYRPADDQLMHLKLGRSFLAGPHGSDDIVRLRLYVREKDGVLVGKVWFGPGAQGPPGHAHGGSIAAVLDEVLGSACWVAGHPVVAVELNARFREMVPLGKVFVVEGWVEEVEGRKIRPRGHLLGEDGVVYAEADGLFIRLEEEQFTALGLKHG